MAKKKAKKQQHVQQFLSPERYIKEKLRTVEIGDCYMTDDIWEQGIGRVVVTRKHNGGRISMAEFVVDTYCLGVRDCDYRLRMEDYELSFILHRMEKNEELRKVSYEEAHNVVYGAVAFAEEGGILPHKNFSLVEYFLEEDDDGVPIIEYDFGKDGQHFLVARNILELTTYLPTLQAHLREDNVGWILADDTDDDEEMEEESLEEKDPFYQYNGYPYTYENHSYPEKLQLNHPEILEIMQKKENVLSIPDAELEVIRSIPHEQLAADLEHIIYYCLGQVSDGVSNIVSKDDGLSAALTHSVMILREVGNCTTSLNAVLEVMRQSDAVYRYFVGDASAQELLPSIVLLGKDNLPMLEEFLYSTGTLTGCKADVMQSMVEIAIRYPEKEADVVSILEAYGRQALKMKKKARFTNAKINGILVSGLVDLEAKELLPMIHSLYKEKLVDKMVCGPYRNVQEDIQEGAIYHPFDLSLRGCYDYMVSAFGYAFDVYR